MADKPNEQVRFTFENNDKSNAGEETAKVTQNPAEQSEKPNDEDLNEPYEDSSSVTIGLVEHYSLFRKANRLTLPKRLDYIGSCIESSRRLTSNKKETETYFPNIIGIMPNNENFLTRVKQYLNNIRIAVDESGVTFNTSFYYYHKKDYLIIKEKLNAIEERYARVNRNNLAELRKALKQKIEAINSLEVEKINYGYPLNTEDYIMYRHCLFYSDIAKDMAFINADANVRFYIKDNAKEEERKRKHHELVNKALSNYVILLGDSSLFDAVYTQYCVTNAKPVLSSLLKERIDRETELRQFASEQPDKFNKIYSNKDIRTISDIEMLIAKGELIKSDYNQNIVTIDGQLIGANMNEALAWFKNPENISMVNAYKAKLKNF